MISSAMNQQKSKSKIRPPRKAGSNIIDPNESWKLLEVAIHDIQSKNASKWSFEQLYRLAYNLVLSKNAPYLYNHVHDEIVKHLEINVRTKLENIILEKYNNSNLNDNISTETNNINKSDAADVLKLFNTLWDDHLICIWLISQVVMYMDRTYTKENRLPLVYDVGLIAFYKYVILHNLKDTDETIGSRLIKIFLNYFNLNRNGEMIEKFLIKSTITIFESLVNINGETYYTKSFEPELLLSSHKYYIMKVNELLELKSGSIYINKIVEIINDEKARFQMYLPSNTTEKLSDLMYKDLVINNIENILNLQTDGMKKWIDNDDYDILEKVYILVERISSTKLILRTTLRTIVIANGEELMEQTKKQQLENENVEEISDDKKKKGKKSGKESNTQFAINYIKNFSNYKFKIDQIIANSFSNDIEIYREIESACTTFLNENNRIQEYLSLYIDDCIKKSLKNKSSEEIENVFNDSIMIFKFIKDKDIFEKYYKNHLAKRLLNQKSISTELELQMISKLKTETGSTFTAKFEGMFKDIKISQDITQKYKIESSKTTLMSDLARMNDGRKFDIDFSILTTNFWPMPVNKTMEDVTYVPALDIAKASFEKFYNNTYNGRNLTWAPNMCTIDLRMNFPSKSYLINMPTLAAFIVLTCFNDDETEDGTKMLTFSEIEEMTNIPTADLIRHLQSISVAPKFRILKKVPMSRDIKPTDKFGLNLEFKNPQTKFKILAVSVSSSSSSSSSSTKEDSKDKFDVTSSSSRLETDSERLSTLESIQRTREFEVDAAIVRVMKARQSAKYQVLVAEVVRLISDVGKRFRPQPSFVKRRVEELVEKEYLRRDDNDRELFWYVA
ncbi:Cullin-3 [Pichia californica]|nr:Cullin-3 [[Candida] californica]